MDAFTSLIDHLTNHPEALGETQPFTRHTTHISEVLVGVEWVYKFKRPVKHPFLDQTERSTRWELCRRELALNRRLSKGIYEEVKGLGQDGQEQKDPQNGEPCVVMRRLADRDRVSQILKEDRCSPDEVRVLASRIADFHGECAKAQEGLHDVGLRLQENLEVLGTLPRIDSVWRTRVMDYYAARRPLVEKREREGRIVDGHGDLRLDHLYFVDGRVQVLDCVEFSEEIRAVDPFEDLAFATMGARVDGYSDWARQLALAYCASSADVEGFALLPLYELYRATVRAKIALLLSRQTEKPLAQERLDQYLSFVESVLTGGRTRGVRKLVVVAGLPATGKSTYAADLGQKLGLPVLSTDVLRKRMRSLKPHERVAVDAYSPESRAKIYQRCHGQAEQLIRAGYGLILDGTFSKGTHRNQMIQLAKDTGCAIEFVEVTASEEAIRRRLSQRGEGASDLRDYATWLKVQKDFDPMDETLPGYRRVESEESKQE